MDRDERGLVEDVISANLISVKGEVKQGVAGDLRLSVPRSVVRTLSKSFLPRRYETNKATNEHE